MGHPCDLEVDTLAMNRTVHCSNPVGDFCCISLALWLTVISPLSLSKIKVENTPCQDTESWCSDKLFSQILKADLCWMELNLNEVILRFKALTVLLFHCLKIMMWCDLNHLTPEVEVTSCFTMLLIQIDSPLVLIKYDYILIWYIFSGKLLNKTENKTVLHMSCSSAIYFQVREQCTLPARIDSQGPVGMAPCVSPILLFTSLDWTQGEINTPLWQVSKQPPSDIYWCRGSAAILLLSSPSTPPEFRFLPKPGHSITGPPLRHIPPSPPAAIAHRGGRVFNRCGAKWVLEKAI